MVKKKVEEAKKIKDSEGKVEEAKKTKDSEGKVLKDGKVEDAKAKPSVPLSNTTKTGTNATISINVTGSARVN